MTANGDCDDRSVSAMSRQINFAVVWRGGLAQPADHSVSGGGADDADAARGVDGGVSGAWTTVLPEGK